MYNPIKRRENYKKYYDRSFKICKHCNKLVRRGNMKQHSQTFKHLANVQNIF